MDSGGRTGDRPSILCAAPAYPWPARDGYRQRLANVVRALCDVGEVDFLWHGWQGDAAAPAPVELRLLTSSVEVPPETRLGRAAVIARGLPRLMARVVVLGPADRPTGVRDRYDLVVVSNVDLWYALRSAVPAAPTIVDFDNLRNVVRPERRWPPVARVGALAWNRLQHSASASCAAVIVCSQLDVERSGCPNAVSVPNGYELQRDAPSMRPAPPAGGGTLVSVALWPYRPNREGARWFTDNVLPLVRAARPNVTLRLVGRGADALSDLAGRPGVDIVGEVDHVEPELDAADISVAPLLTGSGTRLKVLEAFANRIPVVSTSIGVEGIECRHGVHALIADEPARMAEAICDLLDDAALRNRLVASAETLWRDRYQWSSSRARLAALAQSVIHGEVISPGWSPGRGGVPLADDGR